MVCTRIYCIQFKQSDILTIYGIRVKIIPTILTLLVSFENPGKMSNSAYPDLIAPKEQSDQGL